MEWSDAYWMKRALVLARRGLGTTQPNPMVGAIVLDSNGKCVGQGFHKKAGEPHAEVLALDQAGGRAKEGALYVTLEPCAHQGRTPPCTERVIASGVKHVFVAATDPNPLVNGKGIEEIRLAGIHVDVGLLEIESRELNRGFESSMEKKRPFVTAKMAMSLDGKIGVQRKRIHLTGKEAEKTTMRLRAEAGAILVGIHTILSDNPRLNVRGKYSDRRPIRAILDPRLRTPPRAKLFSIPGPVGIFCSSSALKTSLGKKKASVLSKKGAEILPIPSKSFPPEKILQSLFNMGCTSVLIEGGAETLRRFSSHIDRWCFLITPTFLGEKVAGRKTIGMIALDDLRTLAATRRGRDIEVWLRQV